MTPATHTGRCSSQMHSMLGELREGLAVQGLDEISPSRAVRTMIVPPSTQGEVKGVHRLAILQHDVVGDVHDVVDGPHARRRSRWRIHAGEGGDLYVSYHPGGVPGQRSASSMSISTSAIGDGAAAAP